MTATQSNIEAAELLRIFQTTLGSTRSTCDDQGRTLWDRITAARAALTGTADHCDVPECGKLARRLADEVGAEIDRLQHSTEKTYRRDVERLRTTLLPRMYGFLTFQAIEHGFGWEYVTGHASPNIGPDPALPSSIGTPSREARSARPGSPRA